MTTAEWTDAFRKGDKRAMATTLLVALRHAHGEAKNDGREPDIGELATGFDRDAVLSLLERTVTILGEAGLVIVAGEPVITRTEPAPDHGRPEGGE